MVKYIGEKDYEHGSKEKIGVLITNLGTPDAPETKELKVYLNQFLSDPRVIELPKIFWQILLKLVILQIRPSRSAAAYKKVWSDKGSPLLVIANNQLNKIKSSFLNSNENIVFEIGMRYGNPSIQNALSKLQKQQVRRLLVLPMYPQYCAATTGSTFDEVTNVLQKWRWIPELRFINQYFEEVERDFWTFSTTTTENINVLTNELGFRYSYDEKTKQYAHPAVIYVLTPDGIISRQLFGINPDSKDLLLAINEARGSFSKSAKRYFSSQLFAS